MVWSQVVSGIGAIAGVLMVKTWIDADQKSMASGGTFPRCRSCNGSRREPCMCTRWSDGDAGCRTCAGTGMRACSSCGGSGTGRPIPVTIRMPPRSPDSS